MNTHLLSLLCAAALALPVQARGAADVSVTAPWVRATVAAQKSTGAFMHLQSRTPARLVGVSSPAASTVEMHKMDMAGGVMKMARVDAIDLPAGQTVNLASGGYHVMLMGLKKQLKEGDAIELTMQLQGADNTVKALTVKVPVKPITFVSPGQAPAMAH